MSLQTSPLLRSQLAPPPRTLVDVFQSTVTAFPEAHALDNGSQVLSYEQFADAAIEVATDLATSGIGRGDRVGVRISSGTTTLYIAIMGILLAGAAYVPVDADDPDERARTVFAEAGVAAILGNELALTVRGPLRAPREPLPEVRPDDDAWIIFTSGSTGKPKGVAVTHRSAAAFVDAEARLFRQDDPVDDRDRVMAGLSVAFDASCEEMWLAWGNGACLVPAPRSLVKSGMDLGPWLVANRITVVSTVPTLVLLWPQEALARVRLLILGGEACPPEIGNRYATKDREVWNTYGPTEATVVACAAQVHPDTPVRIGLPLDGWDLVVVDAEGNPVAEGEQGELVIGGVGLARYLDAAKDAEKYAPLPSMLSEDAGWQRAYRSGDLVVNDAGGLFYLGRADDQVKVGGRRIELGEVDAALNALPGVRAAAAAVRATASGTKVLVGYLAVDDSFDQTAALATLRADMPAALVPRLAVVDDLPTRTSGKIDRDALPWPLPGSEPASGSRELNPDETWLAGLWTDILGAAITDPDADFFDQGGTSLGVAHLVARIRERHAEAGVTDVYDHPSLAAMSAHLADLDAPASRVNPKVRPVRRRTQIGQWVAIIPLRTIGALRWLTWLAAGVNLFAWPNLGITPAPWWLIALGWALLIFPPGRMLLAAGAARLIMAPVKPGSYPRGGRAHGRLWLAERITEELLATSTSGAIGMKWYARLLGAHIGRHVELHTVPPVTGFLEIGDGATVELEVDLAGHWLDGNSLHIGTVRIGPNARIGMRSTLGPDADVGDSAEIGPGSSVLGDVPAGEYWTGSPAQPIGRHARGPWAAAPPSRPAWAIAYAAISLVIAGIPVAGIAVGLWLTLATLRTPTALGLAALLAHALAWLPLATLLGFATSALLVLVLVRLLALAVREGPHPVQSGRGLAAWATIRVLDEARWWLYPLYAGWFTTVWLRLLGAEIGKDAEASTVLLIPSLASVGEGSFLADDTLLGGYELGGGWIRVDRTRVGKQAFLGNSGMAAPGRKVPKGGLVAVLSAAPARTAAKKATSWIGSPPARMRRARADADASLTYDPPRSVRMKRAGVEVFRIVAVMVSMALGTLVIAALLALASHSWWLAAGLGGCVLVLAGIGSTFAATASKWLLVGRVRAGEHPLWSAFVWRGELADQFVELVTAPWFCRWAQGTPLLNIWLRQMGAHVGKGVWCESYWLPEPDLVTLREGATIERGCVVQTHLFHDRVLSLGTVTVGAGATLCPNSVVLPGATLGSHSTIGPASLVMRGESVPSRTRWIGNPIGPWLEHVED